MYRDKRKSERDELKSELTDIKSERDELKSEFDDTDRSPDERSDVLFGESLKDALFAVFDTGDEWTWRFIEQQALADTAERYPTGVKTKNQVDSVKQQIADAGLLEIKGAAFRLYQTDDDTWRWVLLRENGSVVADGGNVFDTRDGAEESINLFKEHGPEAEPLTIDDAAFDYYRDGGRWRWQLVDKRRNELAISAEAYTEKDQVKTAKATMKTAVTDAGILAIDTYGIELYRTDPQAGTQEETETKSDDEEDLPWTWRLIDTEDSRVLDGTAIYESRNAAETAASRLVDHLENATVIEAGNPAYEVVPEDPDGWNWRLVGAGMSPLAQAHEIADTRGGAEQVAETMKARVDSADVFLIEGTNFEVYTDGSAWRWRLVDEDRNEIAVGDEQYPDSESAAEAVMWVREQVPAAELIEFETAAFQIYEAGEESSDSEDEQLAEWRWRLIDENGDVLADSGDDYGTRNEALESMMTLKQNAPDAELLEIENAAFELYDSDGVWYWRLIDDTGDLIARAGEGHPSREAARLAMDRLVENAPDTEVRAMNTAGFQLYSGEDAWHWWFVLPDGRIIADSATEYATRDQATAAIDDLRSAAAKAGVTTIEHLAIEVTDSNGTWKWKVSNTDREHIAEGVRTYSERDQLADELREIRRSASDIIIFDIDNPQFRVRETDDGWGWDLMNEERTAIAQGATLSDSEEETRHAIDQVRRLAADAETIDYESAAFELVDEDDGWRWQFIDENERVVAAAADHHDDREAAVEELDQIKADVGNASIVGIDAAAFELHETDEGWGWRLVDGNSDVIGRSITTYRDRSEALTAMQAVKESAPDARTVIAEED